MRVVWSPSAQRDRMTQLDWYAEYSVDVAERMARRIVDHGRLLGRFPRLGHEGKVAGTYHLRVVGTPFMLIYVIKDELVQILRLVHTAQNWPGRF